MDLEQAVKQLQEPRNPYDPDLVALRVAVLYLLDEQKKAVKKPAPIVAAVEAIGE